MDKMRMESVDRTAKNMDRIADLFPNCITEALDEEHSTPDHKVYKKVVNFDMLRQMLSGDVLEGEEAYEFTWVGKKAAIVEANKPIRKTLRPCPKESVDWDTTENLYIEGDNLEVLKLLQESYLGKVKMIYIDPPYNTGNDFVYADDFRMAGDEYAEEAGLVDNEGNRMLKNTDTNGRFHSDWCSMIYSRLMLSRNLLSEDGVIFISIDDHEQENMKKICDEVFGEDNFIAQLIWERAFAPKNDARFVSNSHDYVCMYAKSINRFKIGRLPRTEEANARYSNPDNDPRGVWQSDNLSVKTYSKSGDYPIKTPSGRIVEPPAGRCWSLSEKVFSERLKDNRIWFGADGNGVPRIKRFLSELKFDGMAPTSLLFHKDVGHSQEGTKEVTALMEAGVFDGPKPIRLLIRLLTLANLKADSIVLDFFSGSATTAHALMKYNAEKGTHCKFIVAQLPEKTDESKTAYNAGYSTICEIGKERIRRAAKKIKDEHPSTTIDAGFRVFKLDESNMTDVYYSPAEYSQDLLSTLESNVKSDRNDLDLLFGCLLEWGLPLSMPYTSEQIDGCTVHTYNDGDLIACFDENIPDSVIKEIAKRHFEQYSVTVALLTVLPRLMWEKSLNFWHRTQE